MGTYLIQLSWADDQHWQNFVISNVTLRIRYDNIIMCYIVHINNCKLPCFCKNILTNQRNNLNRNQDHTR